MNTNNLFNSNCGCGWKRLCAAVFVTVALHAASSPAIAAVMVEYKNVPVIVNLYQGSNVTQEQINESIKFTNEVYKAANIKFTLVKTNANAANPGDGNSSWTRAERDQGRADGREEINNFSFFNNEGIKVSYVGQPNADNANINGLSVNRHPVTIVKGGGRPTAQIAETTAHEIGHVLGLDDIYDNAETDRLMFGYRSTRTAHQFTDAEKMTLMHEARIRGIVQKKMVGSTPSTSVSTTRGSGIVDPSIVGPQPGSDTAVAASLTNAHDPNILDLRLELGGVIPGDQLVTNSLFVGFDTDNNPATGFNIGPASGIDRHVFIDIFGDGTNPISITPGLFTAPGTLIDGANNAFFVNEPETFNDGTLTFPNIPTFPPSNTVIDIPIELAALQLTSVNPITVTVSSGNPFAPSSSFSFDLPPNAQDLGPQLSSSLGDFNPIGPGTFPSTNSTSPFSNLGVTAPMIDVIGSQFDPLDMIDLFLGDDLLTTVQTDVLGNLNEMVALPIGLPINDFFFITGQSQATGDFGFFVIESTPEPASLSLLTLGCLILASRRSRR